MTTSEPRIIRASVGPKVLAHAADFFNHSPDTIFSELIQNARRAVATSFDVTLKDLGDGSTWVTIQDNGIGINDPADLLRFGGSAWDATTEDQERPAGMGFFSLASYGVSVESKDWSMDISPEAFRGDADVLVHRIFIPHDEQGTRLSFTLPFLYANIAKALSDCGKHAPIKVSLNGEGIEQSEYLSNAVFVVETLGVKIGVFQGKFFKPGDHYRFSDGDVPRKSISFFGHLLDGLGKHIDVISIRNGITSGIEIVDSSAIHLVLPTRHTVVQDEGFKAIAAAAEKALYQYLASLPDVVYSFEVYERGIDLGVPMQIPPFGELHGWMVGDPYDNIEYYSNEPATFIDLRSPENAAKLTFFSLDDSVIGRALGKVLEEFDKSNGLHLVNQDGLFRGYPGYDSILSAKISIVFENDNAETITIDESCLSDLENDHERNELWSNDELLPRIKDFLPKNDDSCLHLVDNLRLRIETARDTIELVLPAISLSERFEGLEVIVDRKSSIESVFTAVYEQTWRNDDDDDSDAADCYQSECEDNVRGLLQSRHDVIISRIKDALGRVSGELRGQRKGFSAFISDINVTTDKDGFNIRVAFSDGEIRSLSSK